MPSRHDRRITAQIRTRASNDALLLRGAHEAGEDYPAHRFLSGATDLSLRAMPQRRNHRSKTGAFSTKEVGMTMQTSGPKHNDFLHSVAGQITVMGIVIAIVLLMAWRYVF